MGSTGTLPCHSIGDQRCTRLFRILAEGASSILESKALDEQRTVLLTRAPLGERLRTPNELFPEDSELHAARPFHPRQWRECDEYSSVDHCLPCKRPRCWLVSDFQSLDGLQP